MGLSLTFLLTNGIASPRPSDAIRLNGFCLSKSIVSLFACLRFRRLARSAEFPLGAKAGRITAEKVSGTPSLGFSLAERPSFLLHGGALRAFFYGCSGQAEFGSGEGIVLG